MSTGRRRGRSISTTAGRGIRAAFLALAVLAAAGSPAGAAEPADANIKAAVYDLDRVAQQLPSLTPQRQANVKRLLRSLDLAAERLAASSNQTHESWTEAKARLDDYRAQLETLMAGGTAKPKPEPEPKQETTTTQEQQTSGTGDEVPRMTSSDVSKFNRLARTYAGIADNLQRLDPKALHGERERTKWRGQIDRLTQDIASFEPFMADPNVAQLKQNISEMADAYRRIESQSLAALEALGDIKGRLQALLARYTNDRLPQPLDAPYEDDRVNAWAQYILAFTKQADEDAAWLTTVRETTDLHDFDIKNALNGTVGHQARRAISDAVTRTRETILQPLQQIQYGEVAHVAKLSPEDTDKIRNQLLGEGEYERFMGQIRDALAAIETGKRIDAALGQEPDPATADLARAIQAMGQKIDMLFETVLSEVRLPQAKSDDPDLLAAAAEVMRRDRYGYSWKRMVINSPVQSKQETRAWWRGNTAVAATYVWKQFQVATAEKVGDEYYIFYNLFHYYTSGDSTTPLDRWILNNRFQSSRILEANIEK